MIMYWGSKDVFEEPIKIKLGEIFIDMGDILVTVRLPKTICSSVIINEFI